MAEENVKIEGLKNPEGSIYKRKGPEHLGEEVKKEFEEIAKQRKEVPDRPPEPLPHHVQHLSRGTIHKRVDFKHRTSGWDERAPNNMIDRRLKIRRDGDGRRKADRRRFDRRHNMFANMSKIYMIIFAVLSLGAWVYGGSCSFGYMNAEYCPSIMLYQDSEINE